MIPAVASTAQYFFPSLQEDEEVSELQCHRTLKMKFIEVSLDKFRILAKQEYLFIAVKALDVLLQFSSSYLCGQAFSCLTVIKSKSINRLLSVEKELRVSVKNSAINFTDTQRETSPSVQER